MRHKWFPKFFWLHTSCNPYHLVPGKLNLPNIIRSKVWKTRIDINATWTKWLWEIIMAIFKTNKESRQIQEFIKQNMVNKNYSCEYIFLWKKRASRPICIQPWRPSHTTSGTHNKVWEPPLHIKHWWLKSKKQNLRTCNPGAPGSTPVSRTAIVTPLPSKLGYLLRKLKAPVSFFGTKLIKGKFSSKFGIPRYLNLSLNKRSENLSSNLLS